MTDIERGKLEHGSLIIYSGPSGVGKGTVRDAVFESSKNQFDYSVSMTTREKRPGEIEGQDYFFITRETFEEKIKAGQMLEYSEYVGNYYGTPLDYVNRTLTEGKDIFLEVDVAGARQIKAKMPDSISIFLAPPDAEELRERLRGRGTESDEVINERLRKASEELVAMGEYDHVVVNDDVTIAAAQVLAIIQERKELKMTDVKIYKETMEAVWEKLKAAIPELPHDSAFPEAINGLRFETGETGVGTWDDELMMLYANAPDNKLFPKNSNYAYSDLTDFLYSPYSDMRQRFSIVSDLDLPEVDAAEQDEIAFYTEAESGSEALPTETAQYLKETEVLYQKYLPERIEALKRHILNHVHISSEVERQYDEIMAHLALGNLDKANLALSQHNSFTKDTEFEYDLDNEGFNLLTADESGKGFDYAAAELNAKYFSFLPSEEAERLWLKTDLQFKRDKKAAEKYIFDNRDKIDVSGSMMQDIATSRFSFEEEGLNIKIGDSTFTDNKGFLEAFQECYPDRGLAQDFVQEVEKFAFQDENNQEESTKVEGPSLKFQKTLVETGWVEGKINGQEILDIDYFQKDALEEFAFNELSDTELLALTNNLMKQTSATFGEICDMAEDDPDLNYWMTDYHNELETYEKLMTELHSRQLCLDSETTANLFDSIPYDSFLETRDVIEALLHERFENLPRSYFAVFDEQVNGFKAQMIYKTEEEALEAAAERAVELSQSDDEPCQPEGMSNREICEDYGYHVEEVSKREAKVIEYSDNKGLLSTVSTSDLERARITSDELNLIISAYIHDDDWADIVDSLQNFKLNNVLSEAGYQFSIEDRTKRTISQFLNDKPKLDNFNRNAIQEEKAIRTELVEILEDNLVGISSKYDNREFLDQSMNKDYNLIFSNGFINRFNVGSERPETLEIALNEEYVGIDIKPSDNPKIPFTLENLDDKHHQPVGIIAHNLKTNRVEVEVIDPTYPNAADILEKAKMNKISKLMENISNKSKGQVR
ncbi:hypothetical protein FACS1894192_07960 [Bacilli bacterium]|nr:hypothetical protein FACS1894192_07960 [Bacilli bacterium]